MGDVGDVGDAEGVGDVGDVEGVGDVGDVGSYTMGQKLTHYTG